MSKNSVLWLPLIILLVLVMILSACSGQPAAQGSSQTKLPAAQVPTPSKVPMTTDTPTEALMAATDAPAVAGGIDCMGAKSGDTLSMLYPWSGAEEEKLKEILKPLVDACGFALEAESTPDPTQLDTRVNAGNPPDIAFSKVRDLAQYKTMLKPMTDLGVHSENYADYWKDNGTVDGSWLGLPVKVDIKTIMWYNPANFQTFGYEMPTTLSAFQSLIGKMAADSNVPWSMGFESGDSTGQIGADVIEDILIAEDGTEYVGYIIDGSLPYNSLE